MLSIKKSQRLFFETFDGMARCAVEAAGILEAMFRNGTGAFPEHASRIKDVEHRCDDLVHGAVRELNRVFITPFDREDIHDLAVKLDDVVDLIDSTADRLVAFNVSQTGPEVAGMTDILLRQTEVIKRAVSDLGKSDHILDRCVEIHTLENEGDRLFHDGLVKLFATEKDPIELLKQKEIIEKMERATDRCEDVANVLEGITLKNA